MTRLSLIHYLPCICCEMLGLPQPSRTEAHHLVDMGNREASSGHEATIPLCGWHHRGEPKMDWVRSKMLVIYGPSLEYQGEKGEFVKRWGTQRKLLEKTNELLAEQTLHSV